MIFSKRKLSHSFMGAFFLLIVIPIALIGFIVYRVFSNNLIHDVSNSTLQEMKQISVGIDTEINNLLHLQMTVLYVNNSEMIDLVSKRNRMKDVNERFDTDQQIKMKLDYLFNYRANIQSELFFFKDHGFYYYYNEPSFDEDEIRSSDWYRKVVSNGGVPVTMGAVRSFRGNGGNTITIASSPTMYGHVSDVEAVILTVRSDLFNAFFNRANDYGIGTMMIVDEQGVIIASEDKSLIGSNTESLPYLQKALSKKDTSLFETVNHKRMMVTNYAAEKTGWRIVNVSDVKLITHGVDTIMTYALAICAALILLFFLFSTTFFRGIITPLNKLLKSIRQLERGNFQALADIDGSYEISQLGMSFNRMVSEVNLLMEQRDLKERERNAAEIAALRYQINPHFINNTLGSVRLMAMSINAIGIKKMLDAFIRLLDCSLNRSGEYLTVAQEIQILKDYVYIMKFRYAGKFDVRFEIDEAANGLFMLGLLLQPIVENAIMHGVSHIEGQGVIEVFGTIDRQDLKFTIRDNGVGMDSEQLQNIQLENQTKRNGLNRIGFRNVDQRIKMNHGERYGLAIESVKGVSTTVRLVLPILKEGTIIDA